MKFRLRQVIGVLRIIGRRGQEQGQLGVQVWTRAGETAAAAVSQEVSALAHKNEVTEEDLATRIKRITADRKVDSAEMAELLRMPATLNGCADRSHDITEAVKS